MFSVYLLFTVMGTCFAAPSNQFFSSVKPHPNCLKLEPTRDLSVEWGLQLFAGARFYLPFGSSQAVQGISKLMSGKGNGAESKDLSKLCALVRIKGFKLHVEGNGDHFIIQDCAVVKKGVNHCTVNERSENPEAQKEGDGIFTIVWTDNQSSMAIARCTSDGLFNDWYVFSRETKLNDTMKADILKTLTNVGFPETMESVSPSYDGCELFNPDEDD